MMTLTFSDPVFDSVLLAVRLLLASVFLVSAWRKRGDIAGFAKNNGLPLPLAYGVVIAEAAAGISMLTGILAQWAGIGLVLLMLLTIRLHVFTWRSPYWAAKGGWEYDLMLLLFAAVIVVCGAGAFVLV